jgi:hypothetical protein
MCTDCAVAMGSNRQMLIIDTTKYQRSRRASVELLEDSFAFASVVLVGASNSNCEVAKS